MNEVNKAGSLGEVKSKRIPGREDVPEEKPEPPVETDELNLNDLQLIIALLDAAASRGTFKIDEYGVVSGLYSKLTKILQDNLNK
jgi:hypothetical protein